MDKRNIKLEIFGNRFFSHLLFFLVWPLILASSLAFAQTEGGSGIYDCFILGVNKQEGSITGYFKNCVGYDERTKNPLICCIFFLYGTMDHNKYQITAWYPGDQELIEGELKLPEPVNQNLFIKLKKLPPGNMAGKFDVEKGNDFPLDSPGSWMEVRVVSAPKTYFYRKPDPTSKRSAYVIKNNVVKVYEKKGGWAFGEYQNTRGWIKEEDLFSIYPPRK